MMDNDGLLFTFLANWAAERAINKTLIYYHLLFLCDMATPFQLQQI